MRKRRTLYRVGQTRIHFDQVEGLGNFWELEVVLQEDQSVEDAKLVAADLMRRMRIEEDDLIDKGYVNLISSGAGGCNRPIVSAVIR